MRKLRKLTDFCRQVETARRHYHGNFLSTHIRAMRLLRLEFSPREIFLWGLLDPTIDKEGLKRFVSKERFSRFQSSVSSDSYACLLEDKEVFYRYCEAIDFPIPETVAFLSDTAAWFPGGKLADAASSLHDRLDDLQGMELIIKPCDGVYGQDIRAFTVDSGALVEDGQRFDLLELQQKLSPGGRYILQRRLQNHPVLGNLAGLKTLQALRVVTALPHLPGHRGRVTSASLRLSVNENVVNNFDYGRSDTVRAKIDINSGRIVRAVRGSNSGFGLEEVDRVSRTGYDLIGFQMPLWQETKDMLEIKAACFYPIRLVGWDVAITPSGPVVIEGNFWFDPTDNAYAEVSEFMQSVTRTN